MPFIAISRLCLFFPMTEKGRETRRGKNQKEVTSGGENHPRDKSVVNQEGTNIMTGKASFIITAIIKN